MAELTLVWVTKYVLSEGFIRDAHVEICDSSMVFERRRDVYYHGKDCHRTRQDAVIRAEEMRDKAIEAARRRLAKLEKMVF